MVLFIDDIQNKTFSRLYSNIILSNIRRCVSEKTKEFSFPDKFIYNMKSGFIEFRKNIILNDRKTNFKNYFDLY